MDQKSVNWFNLQWQRLSRPPAWRLSYLAMSLLILASCDLEFRRFEKISFPQIGYELTYLIAWGWGMEQQLILVGNNGELRTIAPSERIEIFDKPYNSGAVVYLTDDNSQLFIGTWYLLLFADTTTGQLDWACSVPETLELTPLGKQLATEGNFRNLKQIDPGGDKLLRYIKKTEESGPVSLTPPPSKYYANLRYIGRFGLEQGEGRDGKVRFVPASNIPEPRFGLTPDCG